MRDNESPVTIERGTGWKRAAVALVLCGAAASATAQTCTTQAKLADDVRSALADQALALALDVKANNSAKIQTESAAALAGNFAPVSYLVQTTAEKVANDSMAVTQLYLLDASKVPAGGAAEVDFSCPLTASTSETDFTFSTLPVGVYAFAMVEATGPRPWVISLLLEQQGSAWKLAGLYTHARTAAGRDGLSYWSAAREAVKAKQLWRAWMFYAEADALLSPAPFVDTTHLDRLRTEQHDAAPPELADGINAQTPLVMKSAKGNSFSYTALTPDVSEDGTKLRLAVHYRAEAFTDPSVGRARNLEAAQTLLDAHPELRQTIASVLVFAEIAGQPPFANELTLAEIP